MLWSCFLHFYQPPTQKRFWIDRITSESYRRLVGGFLSHPGAKVTLNINAVLFEFWDRYGHHDVLEGLRELLSRGQIELTGTAKYHPLLPKLPEEEIIRQVKLNDETSKKYFGELYNPRGFFPPEMAYDRKVARVAASLGYEWVIAEELSLNHKFGAVDYSRIYEVEGIRVDKEAESPKERGPALGSEGKGPGPSLLGPGPGEFGPQSPKGLALENLKIFFRERDISYKILSGQLGTPELFLAALGGRISKEEYLLTAMDGETFGHHRPGMDKLLMELFEMSPVRTVLVSELPDRFEGREVVETFPSTWALMSHDLEKNIPFARWEDPENEIHQMQWELTNLAIGAVQSSKHKVSVNGVSGDRGIRGKKNTAVETIDTLDTIEAADAKEGLTAERRQWLEARHLLDRALHSDQYWWASARPWWSLEMIERGAKELRDAIHNVPDVLEEVKKRSQSLYYDIITTGFDWQRGGKIEQLARGEDEAVRMRTDEGLPGLPPKEVDKMIGVLKKEMLDVVEKQEYERAAQLRDRVKELERYKKE